MKINNIEVIGEIAPENLEKVENLLKGYNWFVQYIGNETQRNEASCENWKIKEKLKELGVTAFQKTI